MTAGQIKAPTCIPLRLTPGNKQNIDDETPIELSCETPNTTIFYSLNGEKPTPFHSKSRNTYVYQGPFLLTPGKRSIKCMAALPDGRQSNVVTKVYYVTECNPVPEMEEISLSSQITSDPSVTELLDEHKRRILGESFRNNIQTLPPGGLNTATRARIRSGERSPTSPTGRTTPNHSTFRTSTPTKRQSKRRSLKIANDVMQDVLKPVDEPQPLPHQQPPPPPVENVTFTKESEKCPQCFTDKPPNPLSKFCHQCGHYLPPDEVDDKTVKCLHCHSVIPSDLSQCLVCSAILTSTRIELPPNEPIRCGGCNFRNPPASKTCVVCEEKLERTIVPTVQAPPPEPTPPRLEPDPPENSNFRRCSNCKRDNDLIARYCDWCGSSLVDLSDIIPCTKCNFQNPPLALFCGNCGLCLLPKRVDNTRKLAWSDEIPKPKPKTLEVIPKPLPLLISIDTQTDGIFYRSAKRLQADEDKITDNMKQVYKSRGLSLTRYSPGAGNWRQNLEHITNHIKAYGQLCSEYQDVVGKYQFGKVTMATLYKDNDEIHLSYIFSSKKPVDLSRVSTPKQQRKLKSKSMTSVTMVSTTAVVRPESRKSVGPRNSNASSDNLSDILIQEDVKSPPDNSSILSDNSNRSRTNSLNKRKPANRSNGSLDLNGKRHSDDPEDSPTIERENRVRHSMRRKAARELGDIRIGKLNSQIIAEVSRDGDEQRVSRYLDAGGNPNCRNLAGIPVLCLAAKNKHTAALKALVKHGADINIAVPNSGDTALHLAIQQGSYDIVKHLVEQGAKFDEKNTIGKTPVDIAKERHNQRALQLFTANL